MNEIEAHNMKILSGVPAFSRLLPSQIEVLLNAMSVGKYQQDEYVFEQGSYGDAFYVIMCGYAVATRTDPTMFAWQTRCCRR